MTSDLVIYNEFKFLFVTRSIEFKSNGIIFSHLILGYANFYIDFEETTDNLHYNDY